MSYTSSAASSRRQSMMLPPALGSPGLPQTTAGGAESGPGPHRHPRPLTAADLHLQLEREQEAVVNRLTRELAALRAQQIHSPIGATPGSSSALEEIITNVPGATSTAGTSPILHHSYAGLSYPPRHHRTGSNTSISAVTNTTTGAVAGNLSRQNSTRSMRSVNTGGRSSPAIGDLLPLPPLGSLTSREPAMTPPIVGGSAGTYPYAGYYGYQYQLGGLGVSAAGSEISLPLSTSQRDYHGSVVETPGSIRGGSALAETIQWRNELENVKRENEALRQRVRELEKVLKEAAGVEPEGWSGGSVASLSLGTGRRGARSRSSSVLDRGRKEVKVVDEPVAPKAKDEEETAK